MTTEEKPKKWRKTRVAKGLFGGIVVICVIILLYAIGNLDLGELNVDFMDDGYEYNDAGDVDAWVTIKNVGDRKAYGIVTLYSEWDGGGDSQTKEFILKPEESLTFYATLDMHPYLDTSIGRSLEYSANP